MLASPQTSPLPVRSIPVGPKLGGRILELDAIRGIAAFAVLICHLPRGFYFGETGVDLFFVLSGYLITGIIVKNRDEPGMLKTFYWRRAIRIFPIYYLTILVVVILNQLRNNPGPTDGLPYYLTYLQNVQLYWGGAVPPAGLSLGHTWTLAIEEQFYLFWPVAVLLVGRVGLPWLCLFFVALPIVLRSMGFDRVLLFAHTDGLALGGLLFWLIGMRKSVSVARLEAVAYLAVGIVCLVGYLLLWQYYASTYGYTGKQYLQRNEAIVLISLAYFGICGAIVGGAGSKWLGFLRSPTLAWIGQLSYGLYLYHWVIYELLDTFVKFRWQLGDPWWLDVLKVTLSFVVATLSWRFIEEPLLKFKDRFNYAAPSESIAEQANA